MSYRKLKPRQIEHLARNIHPGHWAIGMRPLSTLLGSCVAVCLFDPFARIGGLNHFMLPNIRRSSSAPAESLLAGDVAMEALLDALLQKGAQKSLLQAKAFGGGAIFDTNEATLDIGQRNAAFARDWLGGEGIPLVASDLLGPWSRKVLFLPQTGEAFCRRMVTTMATDEVIARGRITHAEDQIRSAVSNNNGAELSTWPTQRPSPILNLLNSSV